MPQAGYVYILHGVGTNYIKVGKTTKLYNRVQAIGQGVPWPTRLLYAEFVHDMDHRELALKHEYHAYHTRGEWFELPDGVLARWPIHADVEHEEEVVALREKRTRPTLRDRVLNHFEDDKAWTIRELNRRLKVRSSQDILDVILALIEEGLLARKPNGQRMEYLRIVKPSEEQGP